MARESWFDTLASPTVIVHAKAGGSSIRGVLGAVYADGIVLKDARLLEPDSMVEIGGETFVPRDVIEFIQHLQGPA